MDVITKVLVTINTLNQVTVNGKKNLDYLLGSIQTLEQVKRELEENANGEETDQG